MLVKLILLSLHLLGVLNIYRKYILILVYYVRDCFIDIVNLLFIFQAQLRHLNAELAQSRLREKDMQQRVSSPIFSVLIAALYIFFGGATSF